MKLLLFCLLVTISFAAKAPICTSMLFSAQWSKCSGTLLYSYSIQMNVTVDKNNQTFPNVVTLSKVSEYSADNRYYFADTPITYSYFRFWDDYYKFGMPFFVWNSTDTPYTFHYPNGKGRFDIAFVDGDSAITYDAEYQYTFIHNGEIFMNNLPLASPCLPMEFGDDECQFWEVYSNQSICCNNFMYVDVPENENEVCESYQSTTALKDSSQSLIATLNASFIFDTKALQINVNVTDFKSYNTTVLSRYAIGENLNCMGNNGSPFSSCSFYLGDDGKDIRYNFLIDYEWADQNQNLHGYYPPAAIFVRRNGIFLKDDNTLFTSENPCWKLYAEIGYGNGTSFDTSLCCTSFTTPPTAKTTISPTTTTTTTPVTKPPKSCLRYRSMTAVSDNLAGLEVAYKLNSTGMEVNILRYRGVKNSSVQIEVYSPDSFLQPCKATVNAPINECFFALTDNKKYELKMRTTIYKEGFDMLSIMAQNGKLTVPSLSHDFPCYSEVNPYNDANLNLTATTGFCCQSFGYY